MTALMRMAVPATAVLGLVFLAMALSGVSGLAPRLEAATPSYMSPPPSEMREIQFKQDCRPRPARKPV